MNFDDNYSKKEKKKKHKKDKKKKDKKKKKKRRKSEPQYAGANPYEDMAEYDSEFLMRAQGDMEGDEFGEPMGEGEENFMYEEPVEDPADSRSRRVSRFSRRSRAISRGSQGFQSVQHLPPTSQPSRMSQKRISRAASIRKSRFMIPEDPPEPLPLEPLPLEPLPLPPPSPEKVHLSPVRARSPRQSMMRVKSPPASCTRLKPAPEARGVNLEDEEFGELRMYRAATKVVLIVGTISMVTLGLCYFMSKDREQPLNLAQAGLPAGLQAGLPVGYANLGPHIQPMQNYPQQDCPSCPGCSKKKKKKKSKRR